MGASRPRVPATAVNRMRFQSLFELASWLSRRFTRLPEDYQTGRDEILSALASHLDCSSEEAERLFQELEHAGHLRYAAEARSPGGSPGTWIVYPSPAQNPNDGPLDRAVSEPRAGADTERESDPD